MVISFCGTPSPNGGFSSGFSPAPTQGYPPKRHPKDMFGTETLLVCEICDGSLAGFAWSKGSRVVLTMSYPSAKTTAKAAVTLVSKFGGRP